MMHYDSSKRPDIASVVAQCSQIDFMKITKQSLQNELNLKDEWFLQNINDLDYQR